MSTLMNGNSLLYNTSSHSQDYYRFFEVGLGFFLRNGSQSSFVNNYDYKSYSQYFGGRNDITTSGTNESLKLKGKSRNRANIKYNLNVKFDFQVCISWSI